jgi:hypothetical protein
MCSLGKSAGMLITALLILTLAGAAAAETVSGEALVMEKDVTHGTATLEGGIVLQVSESTRILAADGRLITLAQLPVARRVGGLAEASLDATVRYEARVVSGEYVAEELRVLSSGPR